MRPDRGSFPARVLEWTLVAIGVACLAEYAWLAHRIDRIEAENHAAVERMLAGPSAFSPLPSALNEPSALADPAPLIGAIDIPRLRLSAAIRLGDDPDVLAGAVGYLPDTPLPWEEGNTALAAHRDRLFRPLARIRVGDEILVSTRHGNFEYRVSRTLVVGPRDVWVLDASPGVDLTLLTCYPFGYVGHAPQRFVVRAQRVARPFQGRGLRRPLTPYAATSAH